MAHRKLLRARCGLAFSLIVKFSYLPLARRGIEPVKLKGVIDLIADIGFKGGDRSKARDTLGRIYEYFLSKFAQAEGKLGGEFFTPRCVVRVLVEMIEPYEGRVYRKQLFCTALATRSLRS